MEQTDLRTHRTPARLAFANHVNRFIAGDRAPSSPEGAKMLTRVDTAFDRPVILFQDVIEVLHRSMLAVLLQNTLVFELHNRRRVGGVLVGVDDSRRRMVCSAERFGKKALGRGRILLGREKEVEGGAGRIHHSIQVAPLALDPDVGFVHPPIVVGRFEPRAQASFHFRRVTLDPSPHRDVIGVQAPLGEQLLHVAVGKREAQVPTDRKQDHLRFKLAPLEQSGNRWDTEHPSILAAGLSDQAFKFATLPAGVRRVRRWVYCTTSFSVCSLRGAKFPIIYLDLWLGYKVATHPTKEVDWIHIGSEQAGPRVAAIVSVVETCRRLKIPIREYLCSILPGLANFPINRTAELTPTSWLARI